MTDRSLIPLDREYGSRKETVGLMQQAGLTAGSRQTPAAPSPIPPEGTAGAAGLTDFLTARKPSYPQNYQAPDPLARLRNLAQTSPNAKVRALLKEMLS